MATAGTGSVYNKLKNVTGYIFTDCGSEGKTKGAFPPIKQHTEDAMKVFSLLKTQPFQYSIQLETGNITKSKVEERINQIAEDKDLKDVDGIILVFIMYGDHGVVYPSDSSLNNGLNLMDLLEPLRANKCTAPAGKPKIIIVKTEKPHEAPDAVPFPVTIPADADFLYLWSRLPGEQNGDNTVDKSEPASLFITKLCENIKKDYKKEGLCSIMTSTIGDIWETIDALDLKQNQKNKTKHDFPYLISQLREDVMLEGEEIDQL